MAYDYKQIEKKWQEIWERKGTFYTKNDTTLPKWYGLVEFPYPSAHGLHVGHPRSYTALDVIARKKRREGYNVLYPIGFDAFGLPTENYAIKNKIHPKIVTEQNIENFTKQLKSFGFSFDWSRCVDTTDPNYYKWTQWIFIQLFKHGLAYKTTMPINFCTGCKVGLANEEVVSGECERCGSEVVQKEKSQWMLKITEYAERLINDLDEVDYLEKIKLGQKNWIGRSEGAEVKFEIKGSSEEHLQVYTTRPDTLFGATYMVVAPEHSLIETLKDNITNYNELVEYRSQAARKSDFERTEIAKEKTGVEIKGIKAINPLTNEEMSVWISDYVLITYGTGAIMAVPAHDERDFEFAKKFGLPIKQVILPPNEQNETGDVLGPLEEPYVDVHNGIMVNSDFLNGLVPNVAIKAATDFLEEKGLGYKKVNYKLRDWIFSRQRYWGEPIPIVHCDKCGYVHLPEESLPLVLPEIEDFEPGENGESPLAKLDSWINTTCPTCSGPAKRETDTMPQWAGSSWYFLRYVDPDNDKELASKEALEYWTAIDWYNGGMEHTTLHLLYSRFWHKFLYDIGVVPTKEPYSKRTAHGMILGSNSEKMSKSKGNVVNPDDIINDYGADTLRLYEMFIGPFDQATPWSMDSTKGCFKFLDRVWNLQEFLIDGNTYSEELEVSMHKTIKKVSSDIEEMKFNTAIASLMSLTNEFYRLKRVNKAELQTLLQLLNPFSPHIAEEMYEIVGYDKTIAETPWPVYDESKTIDSMIEIPVQINGRVKGTVTVALDSDEATLKTVIHEELKELLSGQNIVKEIYVKNKIYNIVIK
ncbi:MAG: leucine--tRNA ligase [Oscillospiraceae bacterium]|nr:leucine--tRNA ligase [Oscillospiraceae bacterium]